TVADNYVLVNGRAGKQAEAGFVARNHHDGVIAVRVAGIRWIAPDQKRSLNRRASRAATDHASAGQQGLYLPLYRGAEISVSEPPLASALDPYPGGMPQRLHKVSGVGYFRVPGVQDGNVLHTEAVREAFLQSLWVDSLVGHRSGNHHEAGLRS